MSNKSIRKYCVLCRFVVLICIFTIVFVVSGCNRKIGVKPGEQSKTTTSKCRCKKKNALYSSYFIINPSKNILSNHQKVG